MEQVVQSELEEELMNIRQKQEEEKSAYKRQIQQLEG